MIIIFLDIDGVLNSWQQWEAKTIVPSPRGLEFGVSTYHIEQLNKLITHFPSLRFVLSSTWRILTPYNELQPYLEKHGFTGQLISQTRYGNYNWDPTGSKKGKGSEPRGYQIQDWLSENPEVEAFAILDDDSDMEHLLPYLIKTSSQSGLQPHHILETIDLIEKQIYEN